MKLITAIIQENKLDDVREALIIAKVERITVGRVSGHGRQEDIEIYRGKEIAPTLIPKVEIKIAVNDDFVETTCDTIIEYARHGEEGQIGDGKIFVTSLEECIRIRTGEKGNSAI